jgi:ubiquinone/menaquinone biosynthesis C-methylase UbiE
MVNRSASFYDRFASKYDVMIPDRRYDRALPFFDRVFKEHDVKSVLDCSCGTGRYAIMFSRAGLEASGSDLSVEMVNIARRNAEASGKHVDFVQADFKRLADVFERKFDCVVCWGNSLNHELEERGIVSALWSMRGVLKRRGVIIVQIRNLPKWAKEGRRVIPVHYHKEPNGDRKVFIYVLDFHRTRVRFNVISFLEFDGSPKLEVNSVDYRILSARRLKELMEESGFSNLKAYGDLKFTKFNERRSEDIIVVGIKP